VINRHCGILAFLLGIVFVFITGFLWNADAGGLSSLCGIQHPSDAKIEWECRRIKRGETLERLFADNWGDVVRFNRVDRRHLFPGISIKIPKRAEDIKDFTPMPLYYGTAGSEPKFILVDLSEQFLGAYEYGKLIFSFPVATGNAANETPRGEFSISGYDSRHTSSLYFIEKTSTLYPMHYGLRFYTNKSGVAFWIHGRDLPGYPASHGCIGLYSEEMQKKYYGYPKKVVLEDAKTLFEWVISPLTDDGKFHLWNEGPRMSIIGDAPTVKSRPR
jgi:hypothetical protein